jgi:hypothetical protein
MLTRIRRFIFAKDEELEDLSWLISVIDSYRVGMGVEMEGLREKIRRLQGPLRVENWSQIYKDMQAIADLPLQKEPKIRFYMTIFVFMRFLVKQAFLIVGIILFIFLLTSRMPFISSGQLVYLLYAILGIAWLVVTVRGIARYRLKMFFYQHKKDYKKNEERLQKAAQNLIDKMGRALKEREENPKKYSFSIYQKDYKGIKVIKDVSWLRDFYTVTVKKR